MRYLLDTDTCIDAMRGRVDVITRMKALSPADCGLSAISFFELEAGARKSRLPERELEKVRALRDTLVLVSWDRAAAAEAARIRVGLERAGRKIGAYDVLLAGQAMALETTLVSSNVSEVERMNGLVVETWRD